MPSYGAQPGASLPLSLIHGTLKPFGGLGALKVWLARLWSLVHYGGLNFICKATMRWPALPAVVAVPTGCYEPAQRKSTCCAALSSSWEALAFSVGEWRSNRAFGAFHGTCTCTKVKTREVPPVKELGWAAQASGKRSLCWGMKCNENFLLRE